MLQFQYYMPARILFGPGKLAEIANAPLPEGRKALIVTGAGGSMKRGGHLDRLCSLLSERGIESAVFDRIDPNPVDTSIDEGAVFCVNEKCDFVIGLGGGSTVDAAKAIALTAANGGAFWDYIPRGTGGKKEPAKPPLPIVAIPTTAGTGTEADPWMVISRLQSNEKMGYGTEETIPFLSIVDPELMLSLPPHQTAYTGMDAFFHSVETSLATIHQPASDLLAWDAVRLIRENLPAAIKDGSNLEARTNLAWASTAAGICQSLSANLVHHVLEHAISAFAPQVAHGAGLVILSRSFFGILEEREPGLFHNLARALGRDPDKEEMPFAAGLEQLLDDCGLADERLGKYGIGADMIDALVQNVYDTVGRHFEITPVELSRDDVRTIFENSL